MSTEAFGILCLEKVSPAKGRTITCTIVMQWARFFKERLSAMSEKNLVFVFLVFGPRRNDNCSGDRKPPALVRPATGRPGDTMLAYILRTTAAN